MSESQAGTPVLFLCRDNAILSPHLAGITAESMQAIVIGVEAFGAVHVGKEWGELVTAFPGGLGLGMLTYRIRSFWPSAVLHLGTGAIILLTILWTR